MRVCVEKRESEKLGDSLTRALTIDRWQMALDGQQPDTNGAVARLEREHTHTGHSRSASARRRARGSGAHGGASVGMRSLGANGQGSHSSRYSYAKRNVRRLSTHAEALPIEATGSNGTR